jgi:type IV secretory pathway component VirB8
MSAFVHRARPLLPAERTAVYRDVRSFYGMRERLRTCLNWAGVGFGAMGVVCVTASAIGWTILLPLKSTVVQYREIDHANGQITSGVAAEDAEALFGPREAAHYLQQFIDDWEGYDPHLDQRHWEVVREMASPEVFSQYAAWRKSDVSPVKQLGTAGHVKISGADFSPHGKDGDTYEYTVRYRRQEIRDDAVGPVRQMSNVVAFKWHPRAAMTVQEAIDNPGGMEVVSYSTPRID